MSASSSVSITSGPPAGSPLSPNLRLEPSPSPNLDQDTTHLILRDQNERILDLLAKALQPAHFQIQERIHVRSSHPDFVGRQSFLDLLSQPLSNQPSHPPLTVRVLLGPAGFGKTELAIHFANVNKERFSLIWLFHCEIEELFEQEMRNFGKSLGLSLEKEPKERVLHLIYRRLSQGIEDKPYLLIFDNIEKALSLPEHGGFCLLTTRHPNLHPYPQHVIEVSPFSPEETQALYHQLYNKPLSLEHATALTEKLEGYPVLLGLALRELRYVSIEQYLQSLKPSGPLIQQSSERYPQALKAVISAIGRRLEEVDRLAFRFFHLCTHLNPDHISLALLEEWLHSQHIEDPVQVGRGIVHSLTDSSLMQYDAVSEAFSLHRLTQMIFQESHTQESYDQALSLTLQHTERFNQDELASWEKGKEGVAQLPFLHKNPFWQQSSPEKRINLLHQAGDYLLTVQGEARGAHLYFEEALDCSLRQQQNPLLQANSYHAIGRTFHDLGQYEKALENYQLAFKIQLKALGQDHPDVASSYNNIGASFGALGQYEKALENYQLALKIRLKALREDHPDVAQSYHNIGATFHDLGQHEKALENKQLALKIQLKALGQDHPHVAQSYHNIGVTFHDLGQYEKALENKQLGLKIRLKALGQDHPDVAKSYNGIGATFSALGQYEKALENFQLALKIRLKTLGEDHPDVAASYNNIGVIFSALGRQSEALNSYKQALFIQWRSQKESNLKLLQKRMNNFLSCLRRDKQLWKSSVVEEVEGFLKQQLGESHSLTLQFEQAKKQALGSNFTIQ